MSTVSPEGNVSVTPEYVQANEMDSVNLTCTTQSGPGNSYRWHHNGELLPDTTPVLFLNNLTLLDEGFYMCTITNSAGSGSNTATLIGM